MQSPTPLDTVIAQIGTRLPDVGDDPVMAQSLRDSVRSFTLGGAWPTQSESVEFASTTAEVFFRKAGL